MRAVRALNCLVRSTVCIFVKYKANFYRQVITCRTANFRSFVCSSGNMKGSISMFSTVLRYMIVDTEIKSCLPLTQRSLL